MNVSLHPQREYGRLAIAVAVSVLALYSALAVDADHSPAPSRGDDVSNVTVHWHGNTPHYHVAATQGSGEAGSSGQAVVNAARNESRGELRALVINVARASGAVASRESVLRDYEGSARWLNEASRGNLNITVDVFPRDVVVPLETSACADYAAYGSSALRQVNAEISTDGYRLISFVLPLESARGEKDGEECSWQGLGQVGGRLTWNIAQPWSHPRRETAICFLEWCRTVIHEWGHNLGLWHQNSLACTLESRPVTLAARSLRDASCTAHEYGSPFSFMGLGGGRLSNTERRRIGWLPIGRQTTTSDGIITLHRDGPTELAWVRTDEGDIFSLEFVEALQTNGWWDSTQSHNGVQVNFFKSLSGQDGNQFLLDMNPDTSSFVDAMLKGQQAWTDPSGSVTITVLSVTDESATVHVRGVAMFADPVPALTTLVQPDLGVVDLRWKQPTSSFPVTHYEVRVYEGAEQREVYLVGIETLKTRLQIPTAVWNSDYWVSVRAVTEVGVGGVGEMTKIRWEQPNQPNSPKNPAKPCKPRKNCK